FAPEGRVSVDLARVNARVTKLARTQSEDIAARLDRGGGRGLRGIGRLDGPGRVVAQLADGGEETFEADAVLLATGAHPRVMPTAVPDGARMLTWDQVYTLEALPEHLIVVGSGVTGAEFASGYTSLGGQVTLVSSR